MRPFIIMGAVQDHQSSSTPLHQHTFATSTLCSYQQLVCLLGIHCLQYDVQKRQLLIPRSRRKPFAQTFICTQGSMALELNSVGLFPGNITHHPFRSPVPQVFPYLQPVQVTSFLKRQDLLSALLASCHIPRISNGALTTLHDTRVVLDGGITDLIPTPLGCAHTLKIACLPSSILRRLPLLNKAKALRHIAIGPDVYTKWPHTFEETLAVSLRPGSIAFCDALLLAGVRDASTWASVNGLGSLLQPRQEQVQHSLVEVVIDRPKEGLERKQQGVVV